ncbi:hypothetical protein DNTS_025600, partial [Danionella cerebrum]
MVECGVSSSSFLSPAVFAPELWNFIAFVPASEPVFSCGHHKLQLFMHVIKLPLQTFSHSFHGVQLNVLGLELSTMFMNLIFSGHESFPVDLSSSGEFGKLCSKALLSILDVSIPVTFKLHPDTSQSSGHITATPPGHLGENSKVSVILASNSPRVSIPLSGAVDPKAEPDTRRAEGRVAWCRISSMLPGMVCKRHFSEEQSANPRLLPALSLVDFTAFIWADEWLADFSAPSAAGC